MYYRKLALPLFALSLLSLFALEPAANGQAVAMDPGSPINLIPATTTDSVTISEGPEPDVIVTVALPVPVNAGFLVLYEPPVLFDKFDPRDWSDVIVFRGSNAYLVSDSVDNDPNNLGIRQADLDKLPAALGGVTINDILHGKTVYDPEVSIGNNDGDIYTAINTVQPGRNRIFYTILSDVPEPSSLLFFVAPLLTGAAFLRHRKTVNKAA